MTRPPKAKGRILAAARTIVETSGAGALTFDELSKVSGVTRGGITYHFPTKDALLKALLAHDMEQWARSESELAPCDVACPKLCELLGFIRSHTSEDDSRRRFVAGMLSAAVHQPELLDGCRQEVLARYQSTVWTEAALRQHVLRLAAIGLFWDEIFQFQSLPPAARAELVALLERLARDWAVEMPPADSTNCT
jgi:AcrR family transcriptional regulator